MNQKINDLKSDKEPWLIHTRRKYKIISVSIAHITVYYIRTALHYFHDFEDHELLR
jgi:hypothetical protein